MSAEQGGSHGGGGGAEGISLVDDAWGFLFNIIPSLLFGWLDAAI